MITQMHLMKKVCGKYVIQHVFYHKGSCLQEVIHDLARNIPIILLLVSLELEKKSMLIGTNLKHCEQW